VAIYLPQEFENNMKARLGPKFDEFLQSLAEVPPVSIRYNPRKSGDYQEKKIPWSGHGRYLPQDRSFTLDPSFHGGSYYVQEASSMFLEQAVKQSVDLDKPLNVLDLCAATWRKINTPAQLTFSRQSAWCQMR